MSKSAPRIAETFEQQLEAIAHDRQFDGLEIVQHRARPVRGALRTERDDRPSRRRRLRAVRARRRAYQRKPRRARRARTLSRSNPRGSIARCMRPADYERFAGQRARDRDDANDQRRPRRIAACCAACAAKRSSWTRENGELLAAARSDQSAHLEYDPAPDFQRDKLQRKRMHGNSRKHGN